MSPIPNYKITYYDINAQKVFNITENGTAKTLIEKYYVQMEAMGFGFVFLAMHRMI